ncbi:5-oxoprolinase subunit PxpB [Pseudogracilibacillus sp. SO10305]|uniref:5-oxoprolinase subunit PxpB n=1 Tax=Pseudogracilibacillus sp. SO10305 TaxID=3098292 RepID=UPI00300E43E4
MDKQKYGKYPHYFPMGDQAIVAQFEKIISIEVSRKIQSFSEVIKREEIEGITDLLLAYNNLTVCYNPMVINYSELLNILIKLAENITEESIVENKTIHIPVSFSEKHGKDLSKISEVSGLTIDETINTLHKKEYFVYMIGFIAGYPYCGNIDEKLRLNRRANPRQNVKKGTIQIADKQIGIMTMDAPSGWHHVGWTPMEIFNPYLVPPGLLSPGNRVKFIPVDENETEKWCSERQKEWDMEWNL